MPNGQVKNGSTKELWVVETSSGSAIAHKLTPGRQSPSQIDADGFKAVDGTPIDGHTSWVKIIDFSTADVTNSGAQLSRGCILCSSVSENEFGNVTYDESPNWGEPIPNFLVLNKSFSQISENNNKPDDELYIQFCEILGEVSQAFWKKFWDELLSGKYDSLKRTSLTNEQIAEISRQISEFEYENKIRRYSLPSLGSRSFSAHGNRIYLHGTIRF